MAAQTLLALPHLALSLYSAYTLSLSARSITHVQHYEEPTKKAAKWSNIVQEQLDTTVSTEVAGVVAGLLSLTTSLTLLLHPFFSSSSTHSQTLPLTFTLLNAAVSYAARVHIQNFWRKKKKVPFVGKYNDAIDETNGVRRALGSISLGWAAMGVLRGVLVVGGW